MALVKSEMKPEGRGSKLAVEGISKSFSGVRVLNRVSFEVNPGEVHILAGENGAGKTTLIKIMAGVHTDYDGDIILDGKKVRFKSPHEAAARGISAIHQDMSLVGSMSVLDNIFLGREKTRAGLWMDSPAEAEAAGALVTNLGLDLDLRRPVSDYPVAVRQMIEIAKALVFEARILILDEPTSALNGPEAERLFSIIADLKAAGCGIIYISHRLEEIYRIGDRITVLRDGQRVGTTEVPNLPPAELIRWMVGREISQQFPDRSASPAEPALEVEGLFLPDPSGAKRWAVENVGFELRAGEILGVAGLQGSGKSELLNGLFGTFGPPPRGSVRLNGRPFAVRSPRESIAAGLVLLTNDRQGTGLVPVMDVVQNITLASLPAFSPRGWMLSRRETGAAAGHVARLDIKAHSLESEVRTLSGGNQQKVAIAKWLETGPRVLLLDEPTLGVDVAAKHDIYRMMNEWTSRGMAVLLVTSEIEELLAMSDRILVMHRGRPAAEIPGRGSSREGVLRAAMGEGVSC